MPHFHEQCSLAVSPTPPPSLRPSEPTKHSQKLSVSLLHAVVSMSVSVWSKTELLPANKPLPSGAQQLRPCYAQPLPLLGTVILHPRGQAARREEGRSQTHCPQLPKSLWLPPAVHSRLKGTAVFKMYAVGGLISGASAEGTETRWLLVPAKNTRHKRNHLFIPLLQLASLPYVQGFS